MLHDNSINRRRRVQSSNTFAFFLLKISRACRDRLEANEVCCTY